MLTPWHKKLTVVTCAAHTAGTGSASALQVCTQPEKCLQDHHCAGKSSLEWSGGSQCPEGDRMGATGGERSLLPHALSSHGTATTTNHPEQPLPSKGHHLASSGAAYQACLTNGVSS